MAGEAEQDTVTYLVGGRPYRLRPDANGCLRFRANGVLRLLVDNARSSPRPQGLFADLNELADACIDGVLPRRDYAEFLMALGYTLDGLQDLTVTAGWDFARLDGKSPPMPARSPVDGLCPREASLDGIALVTVDDHGARRFVPNAVVRHLALRQDEGRVDLDRLERRFAAGAFGATDYAWFHAMLGYPVDTVRTMEAFAGVAFREEGPPMPGSAPYRARAVDIPSTTELTEPGEGTPALRRVGDEAVATALGGIPGYATALAYMLLRFGRPNLEAPSSRAPFGQWLLSTPSPRTYLAVAPARAGTPAMFRVLVEAPSAGGLSPEAFEGVMAALGDLCQPVPLGADVHVTLFGELGAGARGGDGEARG